MEKDAKTPVDHEKANESKALDKEGRQSPFLTLLLKIYALATGVENVGRFQKKAKSRRHPSVQETEGCAHPVRLDVGKATRKQEFEHPIRTYMLNGVTSESHGPWPGTSIKARLRIVR